MADAADRSRALSPVLRWGALVVLVAVCAVAGWFAVTGLLDARDLAQRDDARAGAVEAAERKVTELTTIGATTSEDDVERLLGGTTADFREEFGVQADSFVASLRKGKVDASGEVAESAVKQVGDDSASVLVAATGSVSNSKAEQAQPRYYRFLVRLVREDDEWLVDGLEFVS